MLTINLTTIKLKVDIFLSFVYKYMFVCRSLMNHHLHKKCLHKKGYTKNVFNNIQTFQRRHT